MSARATCRPQFVVAALLWLFVRPLGSVRWLAGTASSRPRWLRKQRFGHELGASKMKRGRYRLDSTPHGTEPSSGGFDRRLIFAKTGS